MNSGHISRVSCRMALTTLLLMYAVALVNIAYWAFPGVFGYWRFSLIPPVSMTVDLLWWQRLGGFLVSSMSLGALIFALRYLRSLFRGYANGDFFSVRAATYLGKVGKAVLAWVILRFVTGPILSVLLSMHLEPGKRVIAITLDIPDIVALFLAACITVIGWVLKEASQLQEENKQFV